MRTLREFEHKASSPEWNLVVQGDCGAGSSAECDLRMAGSARWIFLGWTVTPGLGFKRGRPAPLRISEPRQAQLRYVGASVPQSQHREVPSGRFTIGD